MLFCVSVCLPKSAELAEYGPRFRPALICLPAVPIADKVWFSRWLPTGIGRPREIPKMMHQQQQWPEATHVLSSQFISISVSFAILWGAAKCHPMRRCPTGEDHAKLSPL